MPDVVENDFCCSYTYRDDSVDKSMKERGVVFKTKEEATEAAKKMLAVLKEDEDESEGFN